MNNQEKLYLFTLSVTNFITVLANTILYSVFPEISRDLNLTIKDLALLVGIGTGMVFPGIDACASLLREKAARGSLAGIYGSVRCFGAALAPISVSLLLGLSEQSLFIIISGVGFLVAMMLLIGFHETELNE
ncbi:MAG: hypothetical protein U9N81_10090 [Bacillota bacterium]|nr:hypothetical protein [Bacillota bacterium]